MKVLSIWCPWPQLIMLAGKDVENRGWSTAYRGPLAIHASKGNHSHRECVEILEVLINDGLVTSDLAETIMRRIPSDRGKIIGVADIVGTSRESKSPWWVPGQVALELASPRLLVVPVAHRGEQGLRDYVLPAAAQFESGVLQALRPKSAGEPSEPALAGGREQNSKAQLGLFG